MEDLPGGSLEEALAHDPRTAREALRHLAELLAALHSHTGPRPGRVAVVDNGGSTASGSSEARITEGALRSVEQAAVREPRVAAVRAQLTDLLHRLAAEVRPRARHTLVHGELGPDHVLLTSDGAPALIDVEGLMYGDVEWEHVFLRLRFGPHYDTLCPPGTELDEPRVRLYRLAMHLGLAAGPLRLLEGDFPDPAPMRAIAEFNLGRVLELVTQPSSELSPEGRSRLL
ncbi:hypothetical protein GCM10027072_18230 [Streptomyces bullii]